MSEPDIGEIHTGECDGNCERDHDLDLNACIIDEYERNDPSWGWSLQDAKEIAAELRPAPESKYFTRAEVLERAMQIVRYRGLK